MSMSGITSRISEPYAEALMSIAKSQDLVDKFGEDAGELLRVLNESADLNQFLANPTVKSDSKKDVLQQVVGDQIHPLMKNFLMLLVDHHRIAFLGSICQQYQVLLRELRQSVLAEVTSAVDLTEEQKQAVRERVMGMTGSHQVELETKIQPDLLGGVIIKVGSQVIDASLRGQLRRISVRLSNA